MGPEILLVEDDLGIAIPLSRFLSREGFRVRHVSTGEEARAALASSPPDLVLLDLMLPDTDGFDLCREISARGVPVIAVTARTDEVDRVVGLELGADDYVTKPFSQRELLARVRAVLRRVRRRPEARPAPIQVGELVVDLGSREARLGKKSLELTPREFDLLAALARRAGTVVARGELLREVWGDWYGDPKTLDVHIHSLRRKLGEDPARPRFIRTVRRVGFLLSPTGEAGSRTE